MKWEEGKTRAFLSHTNANAPFMSNLAKALGSWGVHGFVAHADIDGGREWRTEIREALNTCEFLVAYLTDDWKGSDWTDQEVGVALGRDVPVVAVMAGAAPHGFLADRQGVRHRNDEKAPSLAARIVKSLERIDPRFGVTVLARALMDSGSFDSAWAVVKALREVEYADGEIVALAEQAAKSNSQVYNLAYGREYDRDQALAHLRELAAQG